MSCMKYRRQVNYVFLEIKISIQLTFVEKYVMLAKWVTLIKRGLSRDCGKLVR